MKPTKLQWEDVIQFEEVKGYGQHIWRDGNHLYYVDEEGGIAPQRVVYKLPNELFALLEELERLIPIAVQMWIDWRGKLPDDYVSLLK